MRVHLTGAACALALAVGMGMASPAAAQDKLSIAIMPTQYFSADPRSADNITTGLAERFQGQGYEVASTDGSRTKFAGMGLSASTHYKDKTALRFGREMGTDLVAYPRLLAVGLPIPGINAGDLLAPNAVIHLRVLNVHTGQTIYFRQIAHEYTTDGIEVALNEFQLPQTVATATASEVTNMYFERVAGSRQEFRGTR